MANVSSVFMLMKDFITFENQEWTDKGECGQIEDQLIFIIVFSIIGIVFNFAGVVYLLLRGKSKCFINLLATMAFTDLIFLGLSTSLCWAFFIGE